MSLMTDKLTQRLLYNQDSIKKWLQQIPSAYSEENDVFSFFAWKNHEITTIDIHTRNNKVFHEFARAYCITKTPDAVAFLTNVEIWVPINPKLAVWKSPQTANQITLNSKLREQLMKKKPFLYANIETHEGIIHCRWAKDKKMGKAEINSTYKDKIQFDNNQFMPNNITPAMFVAAQKLLSICMFEIPDVSSTAEIEKSIQQMREKR